MTTAKYNKRDSGTWIEDAGIVRRDLAMRVPLGIEDGGYIRYRKKDFA